MKKTLYITTFMASVAFASNALAGGSCGDNCTWDLTDDGVLTISGTGDMDDFWDYDNNVLTAPWKDQIDSITSVQISNGITSIGNYAFRAATSLTSITIPNNVTSIGDGAFTKATSLTSITIPEGVTSIGGAAFNRATSLTSITIPEGVTSIGGAAFRATNLTSITIPDTAALEVLDGLDPFDRLDLNNVTLHCAGVLEQCQENMRNAGYEVGTYNMVQAPYSKKQADGSRAYYGADGKFKGYKGKRIYTLDEANQVAGSTNRVSIKYR